MIPGSFDKIAFTDFPQYWNKVITDLRVIEENMDKLSQAESIAIQYPWVERVLTMVRTTPQFNPCCAKMHL